ncbi:hypothetical protein B481_0751 [Planococcus halocryophilus Or1]|uniref:Transporter n=1 Tax=Planococcus halocryophilus TaxID=1215089 RepID=A0A1C7DVE7_9BACL|nr:hypothetical protein [Planococcus halocryophilus]ANU15377.1 hypothetical protein BBI08_16605 [Planococcus halocryophilus]EMF47742.1 hypothetical protein B481_0751 [Planococcus halocryophilus Or1]
MKQSLKIASAFIGIVVGAGFASGQEILQYFTSYGYWGFGAVLVATLLFGYLGMVLTRLGSRMQTISHEDAVYAISGKVLGKVIDYTLIVTLFGILVVMIAGAGSIFSQQFDLAPAFGRSIMITLVILTIMLNVKKVITIISSITPFLVLLVVGITVYSLLTMNTSFAELEPIAKSQLSATPHWLLSSINYVSLAIALGAAMSLVMGGAEKDEKIAARGGLIGGLSFGFLILLSYLAIFAKVDVVGSADLPMLALADNISPIIGIVTAVVIFAMIYNTAVSLLLSFSARFMEMGTGRFRIFVIVSGIVAFVLSFFGFTALVNWLYPVVGYLGLLLVGTLVVADIRKTGK